MQAQFIAKNLQLHWKGANLNSLIMEFYGGREFFDEQAVKVLSHRYVHDGFLQRGEASKMTGEWIVFAKQDGIAYYLTMASHIEDDEAIWRRCKTSAPEFPGLLVLQEDRG